MIEPRVSLLDALRSHVGLQRLHAEELVAQVGGHAVVPVFGRHVVDGVAVIAGGVVDQHGERAAKLVAQAGDGGAECRDVAQVAGREPDGGVVGEAGQGRGRSALVAVEEADMGALLDEVAHDGGADAGRAPGDEHASAAQAGIGRELVGHGRSFARAAGGGLRRHRAGRHDRRSWPMVPRTGAAARWPARRRVVHLPRDRAGALRPYSRPGGSARRRSARGSAAPPWRCRRSRCRAGLAAGTGAGRRTGWHAPR